eukprot:277688-Prymnesium_polylepis.1
MCKAPSRLRQRLMASAPRPARRSARRPARQTECRGPHCHGRQSDAAMPTPRPAPRSSLLLSLSLSRVASGVAYGTASPARSPSARRAVTRANRVATAAGRLRKHTKERRRW